MAKKRLRERAEREPATEGVKALPEPDVRALLHELQVYSDEITVQNEHLIKTQGELELARDRYADLYDFAPVGYLSLDRHGAILEINLMGASLLGRQRAFLIGLPLAGVINRAHVEELRVFLQRINSEEHGSALQLDVSSRQPPQRSLRLIGRPQRGPNSNPVVFIAMLDTTDEHRLVSERQRAFELESERARELAAENALRLQQEDRIRALLERLVDVQERERRRLALNLHDHLGQQLTALKLTVGAIREGAVKGPQFHERIDQIDAMITEIDREVDYLAWELRPAALGDGGLAPAMEEFVRQWSSLHRIVAEFHGASVPAGRLPPEIESHLYRIVQEALNNVAKHAQAKRVSVILEVRNDAVTLIVEDDGRGFTLTEVGGRSRPFRDGLGLTGMHERAAAADGSFAVESAPGRGTTVFVRIPLRKASAAS